MTFTYKFDTIMIIKVEIEDKTYARMLEGKRVEGTIGYDLWTGKKDFKAFNRKSREPGYVKPKDIMLYETASGWLKESAKKFKIFVSANKGMGRHRSSTEILRQAIEVTEYLRNTKTIDEIMDEV